MTSPRASGDPRVRQCPLQCVACQMCVASAMRGDKHITQSIYLCMCVCVCITQQNEIPQSVKCYAANVILNRRIHNMHIPQSVC